MTSRGYNPKQSPGLGYKRVVSCKDSFHGTDVLAVPEHGAPGRRPNIHTHFVGRQREDGLDTLPARAAEGNRSGLGGAGQIAAGLAVIDDALARAERTEGRWC